jgi:hypothetical protein
MAIYKSPKSDLTRAYRSMGMFSHSNLGAAAPPHATTLSAAVCTSLISHSEVDRLTFRPLAAQVERRPDLDSRPLRLWRRSRPNSSLGRNYLVTHMPGRIHRTGLDLPNPLLKGPMRFFEPALFERYDYEFAYYAIALARPGTASGLQREREGIQTLLGYISQDDRIRDVRWAAYMMATWEN